MISGDELEKVVELAKKYGAGKLFLFGSSLHQAPEEANDYDFAVQDLPPGIFFKFYGELFRTLSKNVDLVDLSGEKSKFKEIILRDGKLIYDKNSA